MCGNYNTFTLIRLPVVNIHKSQQLPVFTPSNIVYTQIYVCIFYNVFNVLNKGTTITVSRKHSAMRQLM